MIRKSPFRPLWYLRNPHLQTLLANLLHPPPPDVHCQTITLPDGDQLDLAFNAARGPNTVLILHGLEGSLRSAYAQRLIHALNDAGQPAVFMFFRGCNGRPNRALRNYHSGETDDLRAVIDYLKHDGSERIALVGYSLGGNVTLKYLGEAPADDAVVCAVTVSVPFLLRDCAERMNRGFSRVYQRELLGRLKRKVAQKKAILEQHGYATDTSAIRDFVQFDDTYTAPIHGFTNAEDYYQRCSSRQFLGGIDRPTLIIHGLDDPFMTERVIPQADELPPPVEIEVADHGGHVGFIAGSWFKPRYWLEPRILRFLDEHLWTGDNS